MWYEVMAIYKMEREQSSITKMKSHIVNLYIPLCKIVEVSDIRISHHDL